MKLRGILVQSEKRFGELLCRGVEGWTQWQRQERNSSKAEERFGCFIV